MRTSKTHIRSHSTFRQKRLVVALLIVFALVVPVQSSLTAAATNVPTEATIVLQTADATLLPGTFQVVSNELGNQTSPHVDCDIVSYTYDDLGQSIIHYQDLSTGIDTEIPGNQVDLLSDVSGSRVAFTQVTNDGDTIRIFDTISQTTTVVPGFWNSNPSIGGGLVAFEDRDSIDHSQASNIATYDVSTGTVTQLTNDSLANINPEVSPNGDVVTWEKCELNLVHCDIYAATQTSPSVFTTRALTSEGNQTRSELPSTNGEVAVYISNRTGEQDIYYQPLTGGTEVHLAIPGAQREVTISGDLISFESWEQHGFDTFVYDMRSARLFRVTNSLADEKLSEISVCGDTGRIVFVNVGIGAFDTYAFTFQVPSAPSNTQDQLNDLIALIRSFNLPAGTANSLIRKLQNAIDASKASDTATACSLLTSFINECQAQSGKKLTPAQSTQLINSANQIKASIGCP